MQTLRKKLHAIINYSQIENVQYTLAKYMIFEYSGTYKLSINKVMKDTLVSKSSILKFCLYLGYSSWKMFSIDLQNSCEEEKMQIDSIKIDTGMLYNKSMDVDKLRNEYLKVIEEYHSRVGRTDLLHCINYMDKAKKIIVLGDMIEINMFVELQMILVQYEKQLEFAKTLHTENLNQQLDSIDEDTLVIISNSTIKWNLMQEHETLKPVYQLEKIIHSGAMIIYIGQGEVSGTQDYLYQIALPFSFNQNFIHLILQEFIYQLGHMYIHIH